MFIYVFLNANGSGPTNIKEDSPREIIISAGLVS